MGKSRSFAVDVGVYDTEVFVVLGGSQERAQKLWQRRLKRVYKEHHDDLLIRTDEDCGRCVASCFWTPESKKSLIWFSILKPGAGLVVHEVVHAAFKILNGSEIKLNEDTEEAWAYLIDYLTRAIGRKVW